MKPGLYEAIAERSGGFCEACSVAFGIGWNTPECDHQEGRARSEGIESCWMLCRACHHDRHSARPSTAHWLHVWIQHLKKHNYPTERAEARLAAINQKFGKATV